MTSETTPVAIARIDRVALWTARLEQLRDFYAGQLCAQASPSHVDPGSGLPALLPDFSGVGLELIEPPTVAEQPAEPRGSGYAPIALSLGSADAVERLTADLAGPATRRSRRPTAPRRGGYHSRTLGPCRQPHRAHRLAGSAR
jgi:hypothetical protein